MAVGETLRVSENTLNRHRYTGYLRVYTSQIFRDFYELF